MSKWSISKEDRCKDAINRNRALELECVKREDYAKAAIYRDLQIELKKELELILNQEHDKNK